MTHTRTIKLPASAGKPVEGTWNGWPVVERFEPPRGDCAVALTDLSHRPKAVVHGPAVSSLGLARPGQAVWDGKALLGRLTAQQAIILDLTSTVPPQWTDAAYTDLTDGWVLLGLWGAKATEVVQRLVTVDVEPRETHGPLFFATACHGMRVQLFNLRGPVPGYVVSCARSHGQNLFDACVRAGLQFDLKLAGSDAFSEWLGGVARSARP
jgi:hypothetical protein